MDNQKDWHVWELIDGFCPQCGRSMIEHSCDIETHEMLLCCPACDKKFLIVDL